MSDEARIARLTELARRVWPDLHMAVDVSASPRGDADADSPRRIGAWVREYFPQPIGPVEGGPVLLMIPQHPRALDALEAALLVLADETSIGAVRRTTYPKTMEAWERRVIQLENAIEQLAEEWEAQAASWRNNHEHDDGVEECEEACNAEAKQVERCARMLRERAKRGEP